MTNRPPYTIEPLTDFSTPEHAEAFRAALERVESELGGSFPCVIAGERITLDAVFSSTNPTNPAEVIGTFPACEEGEADKAMAAATEAFKTWSKTTPAHRAALLFEAARRVRDDKHYYSAWMVKECGKSWVEGDADTAEAIDFLEYYAREALRYGEGIPVVQTEDANSCHYLPLGVGAVIAPWNFPFAILCGMTVAAAVTGNTVVMKPAEESSRVGWVLFQLLEDVGFPPGVLNFITGDGAKCGAQLVRHPETRFISFTGSKAVGLWIVETAAKMVPGQKWIKRVVAEMGGKDAMVIDNVKDVEEAAAATVAAAFGFQGQKCSACSRAIVHEAVYDEFVEKVVANTKLVAMGDPANLATPFGPVISEESFEKVKSYLAIAKEEGEIVTGGVVPDRPGWFIEPTVVTDIQPNERLAQEEIFGPVLAIIKAKDWDHAMEIANGTEYGLTGGVFSDSEEHLQDAFDNFYVGNLYLNRKCTGALVGAQPFGGFNMSGTCSKAGGPDYLGHFQQQKAVSRRR